MPMGAGACGIEPEFMGSRPIYTADEGCGFCYEDDPECSFPDGGMVGSVVGSHVDNFIMRTWDGNPAWFHWDCGCNAKAVMVFLSAGWCGACERRASDMQALFEANGRRGLRVVWVVGETGTRDEAPDAEYMREYHDSKGATFTIVWDNHWAWVQRYIDPSASGNSLPRQYVLRGDNMKMVYAGSDWDAANEAMNALLDE